MVDEVGYDSAFTFIFSPRRGTPAADLPDQVPHAVKRERMERLVELVQRRATERSQRFVGRTMEVLVEGPSRTDPARLRGRITAQQDRQLRRRRRTRRARAGGDRLGHQHHARRRRGAAVAGGLSVYAIFGPTGVGKSAVADALAERVPDAAW